MNSKRAGFTLVELITIIVVLGILGAFSAQFIVTSVDSYRDAQVRARVLAKGRLAIEQITRYLRNSVPNSVRVSASGNCIEFMPSSGGAFYIEHVADSVNGAPVTSAVTTSPFNLDLGTADHIVIGSLFSSEIYTAAMPSARVGLGATTGSPIVGLSFDLPHRFIRNSINKRVYVGSDPKRFCLSAGSLFLYENYGLDTSSIADTNPGGASVLMADSVSAVGTAFTISPGTEDRSAVAAVSLSFQETDIQVAINQHIYIRNVP